MGESSTKTLFEAEEYGVYGEMEVDVTQEDCLIPMVAITWSGKGNDNGARIEFPLACLSNLLVMLNTAKIIVNNREA